MTDISNISQFITPLAIVIGGLALGFIFEKIIILELKQIAARTKWEGDEVLISSLRGIVMVAFLTAGGYIALFYLPISPAITLILQRAFKVVAILIATVAVARITSGFVNIYIKGVLPSTSIFTNITQLIVYVLGALVILQSLGISITPVLTALGVGGLGVALALQDTLSNLFAGVHIIASKQVRAGDYIKLETGEEGYVTDITWRNTTINALRNNTFVVPNAKLASSVITNYNQPEREMSFLIEVGVSYDSDLEKVEEITSQVAEEVTREIADIPDFKPFVRYHTFDDSSINFTVILRAKEFVDKYPIKHEFIKRLHKRYAEEGIDIPFPIRTVMLNKTGGPSDEAQESS